MSAVPMRRGFWWITLAAVVAIAVTASLGFWQLGRADQKLALQAQREQRQAMPPVGWEAVFAAQADGRLDELHDRAVRLAGQWVHEATVFLDNRTMNGRVGFVVLTPLRHASGQVIVVQRGWVPRRMDDRTALPELPQIEGVVTVEGRLAPPPSRYYEFAAANEGVIRQNIDLDAYGAEWSLALLPASVQQVATAGEADDGLWRDWPVVGSDVHKHYGYAFQWFGLSTLTVILYVWFQIIVPRRRR